MRNPHKMNTPPIAEEGGTLYACPDVRANKFIAEHYGLSTDDYIRLEVRCSDGSKRNLWIVNMDLLVRLSEIKPRPRLKVFKQNGDEKPWPISWDYLLLRTSRPPQQASGGKQSFPEEKVPSPFD